MVAATVGYAGEIWFNPDYVVGGTTGILTTNFGDSVTGLVQDPPTCYMHRQASFIAGFFPDLHKVHHQLRKYFAAGERLGDGFAVGDFFAGF